MVQLSYEIKAISAPSWGLAGWLGLSLAKISIQSYLIWTPTTGLVKSMFSSSLASMPSTVSLYLSK